MLRANRHTPPSPPPTRRNSQAGGSSPMNPGSRQRSARTSSESIGSALNRARSQPARYVPLDEKEEDDHRQRGQGRAGHEAAPVRSVLGRERRSEEHTSELQSRRDL